MVRLRGGHDDPDTSAPGRRSGSCSKAMPFAGDLGHAAAVRAATEADRQRYLTSGLQQVDCRFCHVTVSVKKLGPGHTAVQWNTEASRRCAHFAEIRAAGGDSARTKACPKLTDSIAHAVAEGFVDPLADG
ncbi:hypothetical protein [Mycobacterium sp.]|uniref:hypothetical protein n=1 Tax=Mycobacterium sp. TaxID=1785 RepID=UPI0031DCB95F